MTSDGAGVGTSENKGWRGAATGAAPQLWKTKDRGSQEQKLFSGC